MMINMHQYDGCSLMCVIPRCDENRMSEKKPAVLCLTRLVGAPKGGLIFFGGVLFSGWGSTNCPRAGAEIRDTRNRLAVHESLLFMFCMLYLQCKNQVCSWISSLSYHSDVPFFLPHLPTFLLSHVRLHGFLSVNVCALCVWRAKAFCSKPKFKCMDCSLLL